MESELEFDPGIVKIRVRMSILTGTETVHKSFGNLVVERVIVGSSCYLWAFSWQFRFPPIRYLCIAN